MEAAKQNSDEFCEFEVFTKNGKLVLKDHNNLFLSRVYRDGVQGIEAAKEGVDEFCMFTPVIGDLIPPKFEILDVTWDSSGKSVIYNPTVVTDDSYSNDGSNDIVQKINLKWSNKTTETTTWKHAWGFESSFTYKSSLIESTVAAYEFQAKISYNGSYGKSSTEENTASFSREVTFTAAPHKKTVASMMIKKADNVELPFTTKIRRTNADGDQSMIYQQGTWSGIAYQSVQITVCKKDL